MSNLVTNAQTTHKPRPRSLAVGRFAPSPTGPLHLGSLATALASWLDARRIGGQWLVRIEDIDSERCRPEYTESILESLKAHGLKSDGPVWMQSERHAHYQETLDKLGSLNLTYPCACTRREIDHANALRPFGQNRLYPGTCRKGLSPGKAPRAIRFKCASKPIEWQDHRLGYFKEKLEETSGDFVLKRGDGQWAYHLAVVVDDIASGVTHLVRGEDLADTTARQMALYDALGARRPVCWHLPVILADDGQKLSKQTGAQALDNTQPMVNLNRVWKHFGMQAIQAQNLAEWLTKASGLWPAYADSQAWRGDSLSREEPPTK